MLINCRLPFDKLFKFLANFECDGSMKFDVVAVGLNSCILEIDSDCLPVFASEQFEQLRRKTGLCLDPFSLTENLNSSTISLQSDCCSQKEKKKEKKKLNKF